MVKHYTNTGGVFHGPPYTEEEEREFYRRTSGVVAFTRRAPAAASPEPTLQDPTPSEPE
ncbi:MAG: hypothetical protein ACOYM5_05740 [Caulobacter sp.]